MKYIRTKDGIYKSSKNENAKIIEQFITIKQADTIEELCDMLVITDEHGTFYAFDSLINKKMSMKQIRYEQAKIKRVVYAAIWTDKGLIYVAKMNDKGELELL